MIMAEYTTIEQSRKLIELGIDVDTAEVTAYLLLQRMIKGIALMQNQ